jgi:hypothetical protein
MVDFKLPENLTTFDYEKIVKDSEIVKGKFYEKPKTLFELKHTLEDKSEIMVPVLTKGNLSAIQGKAKARKTFFITLATKMIIEQNDIKIAIFDTEQFQYHSALMFHRINQMIPHNQLKLFNLRKYSIDVRLEFAENYILKEKPDLIFLDNIRDCMININSWEETNKILTIFIQLADDIGTHICLTLHENPGADNEKARGAIGTELQNKCETVFRLEKNKDKPNLTVVKGIFTRNREFDPFVFKINESGLPELDNYSAIVNGTIF